MRFALLHAGIYEHCLGELVEMNNKGHNSNNSSDDKGGYILCITQTWGIDWRVIEEVEWKRDELEAILCDGAGVGKR